MIMRGVFVFEEVNQRPQYNMFTSWKTQKHTNSRKITDKQD